MKQIILGVFFVSMFLNLPTQVRAYTLEDTVLGQYLATTTQEAQLATTSITFATSTLPEAPKIPSILEAVAGCESGNGTPGSGSQFYPNGKLIRDRVYGTHVGKYQISLNWIPVAKKMGMDIYTEKGNEAFALYLYKQDGLRDWTASKGCWNKYY